MNWEYITGFFDADGYITICKQTKSEHGSPVLGFTNTKLTILTEIQLFILNNTGIKGIICKKTSKNEKHNDSYDLKYAGYNKIEILKLHIKSIHPKKIKRLELLTELKNYTPRNGKYNKEVLKIKQKLTDKFLNTL